MRKAVSSKSFLIPASLLVPPTKCQSDVDVTGLGWETSVPRFRNYQMLSMLPLHTISTYIKPIVVMGRHKTKDYANQVHNQGSTVDHKSS